MVEIAGSAEDVLTWASAESGDGTWCRLPCASASNMLLL